jgi:hypothetical protein
MFGCALFRQLLDNLGVFYGERDRLLFGIIEDDGSEQTRSGIIHVQNYMFGTSHSGNSALDEICSGRGQDL